MKRQYFFLLLLCELVLSCFNAYSQDPNFNTFHNKESYFNPAYMGLDPGFRANATNRFSSPHGMKNQLYQFSADYNDILFGNGALGINAIATQEQNELLKTRQVGILYAKRVGVSRNFVFNFGTQLQYSYYESKFYDDEFDVIIFKPQIDDWASDFEKYRGYGSISESNIDFSIGGVARFNKLKADTIHWLEGTVGVALHHIQFPPYDYEGNKGYTGYHPFHKIVLHVDASIKPFQHREVYFLPMVVYTNKKSLNANVKMLGRPEHHIKTDLHIAFPIKMKHIDMVYVGSGLGRNFKASDGEHTLNYSTMHGSVGIKKEWGRQYRNVKLFYSYSEILEPRTVGGILHEITLSWAVKDLAMHYGRRGWCYVKHPADRFQNLEKLGR